jgi:CRISPR-associated protein Cas2
LSASHRAIRGDLTRWLLQPRGGVFVGDVPAAVRDRLWQRVCTHRGAGACLMVTGASENEQGFELRQHGDRSRELVDIEGFVARTAPAEGELSYRMAHRASRPTRPLSAATPSWCSPGLSEEQLVVVGRDWVVIDTETTGLDPARHEVTQMAAVVLDDQCQEVADLAWETDDGHDLLRRVIADLNPYVGAGIVVAHNLLFDLGFLAPLASPARGRLAHPPR